MNPHFIWNFEFSLNKKSHWIPLTDQKDNELKWEVRYFWPDHEPIILNLIDPSLLDLTQYQHKHKEDYYYLLPHQNLNIKKRNDQLFYKPLLQNTHNAFGFGPKKNITLLQDLISSEPKLHAMMEQVTKNSVGVLVKKEALIYKFPTTPKIKLELARLEILEKIYFSICIEGKSLYLVETISKYLLDDHISCDYVTFLKSLLKLC